jgi:hypothetical protein
MNYSIEKSKCKLFHLIFIIYATDVMCHNMNTMFMTHTVIREHCTDHLNYEKRKEVRREIGSLHFDALKLQHVKTLAA